MIKFWSPYFFLKLMKKIILALSLLLAFSFAQAQGLKTFKLKNGLTVFIWEDHEKPDVYGNVVVRAGSMNEPANYTGLAHYLEHVLFKGTQKIGALDWEAEKPVYEQIIAKYDERAAETDPEKRAAIDKEINRLTVEQGKISLSQEYSSLIEGMGGTGLNAATTFDYTYYHNSFPAYQINSWLEVASERFLDPVFRLFQSELETVYEEYNMGKDNPSSLGSEFLFAKAFEGHPYARGVIGLPEHLKNPQLSVLMDFYQTWYVPDNMALILVGNVDTRKVMNKINMTFGRLPRRPVPERTVWPELNISGRTAYTTKFSQYPEIYLVFPGIPEGHADENALDVCLRLLSNNSDTGILDKLVIDDELMMGIAQSLSLREQGRIILAGVPSYDNAQRRFTSSKAVEKKLLAAIKELTDGKIDPDMVEAIKANLCRDFTLSMESNESKSQAIMSVFVNETPMSDLLEYTDKIMAVTVDQVKEVAKKYLGKDYIAIFNEQGKPEKASKIRKPDLDPIEPPVGVSSEYAKLLRALPVQEMNPNFVDWNSVQQKKLNTYSNVYYTENKENDVFTLTVRYGVGTHVFPKLEYAADLMSDAGIMGGSNARQVKEELSKLHATMNISADESYLYITLRGFENTLQDACMILTRQMLMPDLDQNQLNSTISGEFSQRMVRKNNVNYMAQALSSYINYGEHSPYIEELSDEDVYGLDIATLTGDINRATHYASDVFYSGTLPFDTVYAILSSSLPLTENEMPSMSPYRRPMAEYKENTVFFLPNSDAQQSQVFFYIPMGEFDPALEVKRMAFSQYISGGFSGLIMNEIREKNSMAYTAYGQPVTDGFPGSEVYFTGYMGTQNDKALGAIELYHKLLTDMPEHPERIDNIKSYLRQVLITRKPSYRSLGQNIARWKQQGYTQDPAIEQVKQVEALTFQDVLDYYNQYVKGKPIIIGVLGNPKDIPAKQLSAYGKVVRLSDNDLFNQEGKLF